MDGKRAEQIFMNNLANKTLRNEYMSKAQDIGSNAIKLVNDFFSIGIQDNIDYLAYGVPWCYEICEWTLADLDRALDAIKEDIVANYLKEFCSESIDCNSNSKK